MSNNIIEILVITPAGSNLYKQIQLPNFTCPEKYYQEIFDKLSKSPVIYTSSVIMNYVGHTEAYVYTWENGKSVLKDASLSDLVSTTFDILLQERDNFEYDDLDPSSIIMTAKAVAKKLNNCTNNEVTHIIDEATLKANNLVLIVPYSDDILSFFGKLGFEIDCWDCAEVTFNKKGDNDTRRTKNNQLILSNYKNKIKIETLTCNWDLTPNFPCVKFNIFERDGVTRFGDGFVTKYSNIK